PKSQSPNPRQISISQIQKGNPTKLSLNLGPWDFLGSSLGFGNWNLGFAPPAGARRTLARGSSTFLRAGVRTPAKYSHKKGKSPDRRRPDDNASACTSKATAPGSGEQTAQIGPNTPARSPG